MGNTVRWLTKFKNPNAKHDTTKWCKFHSDHSHTTTSCITLRLEVAELLKRDNLKDLLTDKGKSTFANKDHYVTTSPKEPTPDAMCHVILGGSNVSGVSYSSAKHQV